MVQLSTEDCQNDTSIAMPFSREECSDFSGIRLDAILCMGAGYVGGPTMAMIAHKCPELQVYVVDVAEEKINAWNSSTSLPVYEPGLLELVTKCRGKNLFFSTEVSRLIERCDIIFVSVNTPTKSFGVGAGKAADLSWWDAAARCVASCASRSKIVIEKSTVPVRTAELLQDILKSNRRNDSVEHVVLSNPEFLAEGSAIFDLEYPDRVLIGGQMSNPLEKYAIEVLKNIYRHWVPEEKILITNTWSAELSKLAANAFLAQRISSTNCLAMLCEKTGADVREVTRAVGADSRIGPKFLQASVGFGGSCLEKDVLNLAYLCEFYGLPEVAEYWLFVKRVNDVQKHRFAKLIIQKLCFTVFQKKIAIFGFAFKKNTSDTRQTPAIDVCSTLLSDGALLTVYDPCVSKEGVFEEFQRQRQAQKREFDLKRQLTVEADVYGAVRDTHAIVVLTEWDVFRSIDYKRCFGIMKKPAYIFDGRNILNRRSMEEIGFKVFGIGTH